MLLNFCSCIIYYVMFERYNKLSLIRYGFRTTDRERGKDKKTDVATIKEEREHDSPSKKDQNFDRRRNHSDSRNRHPQIQRTWQSEDGSRPPSKAIYIIFVF